MSEKSSVAVVGRVCAAQGSVAEARDRLASALRELAALNVPEQERPVRTRIARANYASPAADSVRDLIARLDEVEAGLEQAIKQVAAGIPEPRSDRSAA